MAAWNFTKIVFFQRINRISKEKFSKEKFFYEKGNYLRNGISLTEALVISEDKTDLKLREMILDGLRLCDAMKSLNVFKDRELSLIRLAEETGDIAGTFESIHITLKDERELKEKIMTVLLYPLLLLVSAVIFFLAAVYYIVPPLHTMLMGLGTENKILAVIYEIGRKIPFGFMSLILILIVSCGILNLRDKEKLFRLVLGKNMKKYQELRFIDELQLLSGGGLDLLECFKLLEGEGYPCHGLAERIIEGTGFKEAFREEGYSSLLVGYLTIAEETGDYHVAFQSYIKLQKVYFRDFLKKRTAMIEPLSIVIMGAVVFMVSFLIMIPMLDAYENL